MLLPGKSSFREVRVRIDDRIVGMAWPFPTIFTGGVAPPLHRPLVGIDAFDIAEHEIDITPWLGLLCDNQSHNVSLEVIAEGAERAPASCVLSAKIFVWLSSRGSVSRGDTPRVEISPLVYEPELHIEPDKRVRYRQSVQRTLSVPSNIRVDGHTASAVWYQQFDMNNDGDLGGGGSSQKVMASYGGSDSMRLDRVDIY